MGDPGQTAVKTLSHRPDRAAIARTRCPRMFTPDANRYGPGLEHRSPGPIDVIAALAALFEPFTADRTCEFGESHPLHPHEKMGKAK
jgi:hypothetical protein